MTQHSLTSRKTTDEIEAQGALIDPLLSFRTFHPEKYTVGDGVVLTAADGGVFLGEVADVEDARFYVELW